VDAGEFVGLDVVKVVGVIVEKVVAFEFSKSGGCWKIVSIK